MSERLFVVLLVVIVSVILILAGSLSGCATFHAGQGDEGLSVSEKIELAEFWLDKAVLAYMLFLAEVERRETRDEVREATEAAMFLERIQGYVEILQSLTGRPIDLGGVLVE